MTGIWLAFLGFILLLLFLDLGGVPPQGPGRKRAGGARVVRGLDHPCAPLLHPTSDPMNLHIGD